jgi:hypothetical protein
MGALVFRIRSTTGSPPRWPELSRLLGHVTRHWRAVPGPRRKPIGTRPGLRRGPPARLDLPSVEVPGWVSPPNHVVALAAVPDWGHARYRRARCCRVPRNWPWSRSPLTSSRSGVDEVGMGSSSGMSIRVDPSWWDEFRQAVAEADDPVGEVDQAVAGFAEHHAIAQLRFPTTFPRNNVVDFAP